MTTALGPGSHAERLAQARAQEQGGDLSGASECYQAVLSLARTTGDTTTEAHALRRLGVLRHHNGQVAEAIELCRASFNIATQARDRLGAAEALNSLAGIALETGDLIEARHQFLQAQSLGADAPSLWGRIEQNLGILANVQGDWEAAREHYLRSLVAFERSGDDRGCALAFHNLGMISADQSAFEDADRYFEQSHTIAERLGEVRLQGLCRLNQSEAFLGCGRHADALRAAEAALRIFERIGSAMDRADGYRVLGAVYRATGRPALAEARLATAIELSHNMGAILSEAEAARELAQLYRGMGRNRETLELLNHSHRLFGRLDARRDLVDVGAKVVALEDTFLAVVQEWGQSIESADSYTFGHCERVAKYGVAVAEALGVDESGRKTIQLGAYLHDLGKVKVPHEILNKPGRLTSEEFAIIKQHPVWGLDLLSEVEFPWDIKPIIRSHHERVEGRGYPDGLSGESVPLHAMIICVADVWDALTTNRSYRPSLSKEEATAEMVRSQGWWRPEVFAAFERTVPALT